jgi:hypothetical protein
MDARLPLVVLATLPIACQQTPTVEELRLDPDAKRISIVTDVGSVRVSGSETDVIHVSRTVRGAVHAIWSDDELDDGTLRMEARCGTLLPCDADVVLSIPPGIAVEVRTGDGVVNLDDIDADVRVEVGDGDVYARDLGRHSVHVQVGWGDVSLAFTTEPTDLSVALGGGDTTVRLPEGRYDLDVESLAAPDIRGLHEDESAPRIHVRTTSGRATLIGTPRATAASPGAAASAE